MNQLHNKAESKVASASLLLTDRALAKPLTLRLLLELAQEKRADVFEPKTLLPGLGETDYFMSRDKAARDATGVLAVHYNPVGRLDYCGPGVSLWWTPPRSNLTLAPRAWCVKTTASGGCSPLIEKSYYNETGRDA